MIVGDDMIGSEPQAPQPFHVRIVGVANQYNDVIGLARNERTRTFRVNVWIYGPLGAPEVGLRGSIDCKNDDLATIGGYAFTKRDVAYGKGVRSKHIKPRKTDTDFGRSESIKARG
jgi:hypothetical protein